MHRGITGVAAACALIVAAVVGSIDTRPRERNGVVAPRSAADRGGSVGRPHGSLRVPEPGQAEYRHDSRQCLPGEDPAAGPNWYTFSPNARYNLTIDTNGDARPNVTYRFQFHTKTGPFFLGDTAQPFTVTRVVGHKSTVVARGTTPPNNIGPRSTPNYRSLAAKGVVPLAGGGHVFAGQRDRPVLR